MNYTDEELLRLDSVDPLVRELQTRWAEVVDRVNHVELHDFTNDADLTQFIERHRELDNAMFEYSYDMTELIELMKGDARMSHTDEELLGTDSVDPLVRELRQRWVRDRSEIKRLATQLAERDAMSTPEPIEFDHYRTSNGEGFSTLSDAINHAVDVGQSNTVYGCVRLGATELTRWVPHRA